MTSKKEGIWWKKGFDNFWGGYFGQKWKTQKTCCQKQEHMFFSFSFLVSDICNGSGSSSNNNKKGEWMTVWQLMTDENEKEKNCQHCTASEKQEQCTKTAARQKCARTGWQLRCWCWTWNKASALGKNRKHYYSSSFLAWAFFPRIIFWPPGG